MVDVQETCNRYTTRFESSEHEFGQTASWLLPTRKAAIARFAEMGFPTTRVEEWHYTNVAPIAQTPFAPLQGNGADLDAGALEQLTFRDEQCARLVFVNGTFAERLSDTKRLPEGLTVTALSEAMTSHAALLEKHLARHADYQNSPFTALNTAFLNDGAFIHIPRGVVLETPVHIVYVTTPASEPGVSHPRSLFLAEVNSQATFVESYVGQGEGTYFTNAVTEIVADENAVLDHYKVTNERDDAYHIATLQIHQYRSSNVTSQAINLGGRLVRNDVVALLDGEGCHCTLNGLTVLRAQQHVDNHLWVEHAKPHCNSWEYYKGIYDDHSRGVFSGRIRVHEDAQKTDAKQTNMSLLLSEHALADSKPQLEIFADDVKCTHGATIGQIDEDAIFYLRSRGIDGGAARSLLVYAFASENIETIRIAALRQRVREALSTRLPQGELIREAM